MISMRAMSTPLSSQWEREFCPGLVQQPGEGEKTDRPAGICGGVPI